MPKLFYASSSPYSSKVRMAALYAGIAVELVPIKTEDKPAELIVANPLGKIPVLVLDDGRSIHDSRAITQHLNRASKNLLLPRNSDKRLEAEVLEALADGICDCALSMVYERRTRPEENGLPALARPPVGEDHRRTRPPQRQSAETAEEDHARPAGAARLPWLPLAALRRRMGKGPRQADPLGSAFRREVPGTERLGAGVRTADLPAGDAWQGRGRCPASLSSSGSRSHHRVCSNKLQRRRSFAPPLSCREIGASLPRSTFHIEPPLGFVLAWRPVNRTQAVNMAKSSTTTGSAADPMVERLRTALGNRALTEQKMFGGTCFLIDGNMLVGTSKRGLLVRVARPRTAPPLPVRTRARWRWADAPWKAMSMSRRKAPRPTPTLAAGSISRLPLSARFQQNRNLPRSQRGAPERVARRILSFAE